VARKPRIQFAGALYHVINRGNYRHDVFATAAAAQAFEQCLFQACERMGWRLHAYAFMRNHYHLALATPRANLVEGMHWLQGTFATRFNRFRDERGHLFQGRYQALLIEPGPALAKVVNYIHLNPVRAQIVPLGQLAQFRWNSYGRFIRGGRPEFLVCADWLQEIGGLTDTPDGWQNYLKYLNRAGADESDPVRAADTELTQGWAIGSPDWRKAIAKEYAPRLGSHRLRGQEVAELKQADWSQALDGLLQRARRTRAQAAADWKGAGWKVAIAASLRSSTTATNAWIAREMHMGSPSSLSVYLSKYKN
jgi:putative transposase